MFALEQKIKEQEKQIVLLQVELSNYQKRCEQYAQAYDQLTHQLKELIRNRFGRKSERCTDPDNPQFNLFDSNRAATELDDSASVPAEELVTVIAEHTRKKKKTAKKDLPCRIEIIPVSDEDKQCSCGCTKVVINYEIKSMIHHQPAVHEIIEQRREIVACPNHCEGSVKTASAPAHVLPKVKASPEFLAFLIVSKMEDRQPLYHLEKQLAQRHGIDCSRQTMARWLIDLTTPLQPFYNLFKDNVIEHDIASCDATTLQVLNEPGRKAETKSYVYCIRGGPPEEQVTLYDYNYELHKQFVDEWFTDFKGYVHVDGDNFFDQLFEDPEVLASNCNAHARRKFEAIAKGAKGKGLAKQAMAFYKALYKIERDAKNGAMTSKQRYELRQRESKPLMEKFKQWLDESMPTVLPASPLGQAIQYCLNRWDGLCRFLDDGRLEIDNNLTEQQIKPFVIARKNFLFADSMDGAKALCMHFSIIRTAKQHGLDAYHYYVQLLKGIPHCKTVEDYEKLLPWNVKPKNTALALSEK